MRWLVLFVMIALCAKNAHLAADNVLGKDLHKDQDKKKHAKQAGLSLLRRARNVRRQAVPVLTGSTVGVNKSKHQKKKINHRSEKLLDDLSARKKHHYYLRLPDFRQDDSQGARRVSFLSLARRAHRSGGVLSAMMSAFGASEVHNVRWFANLLPVFEGSAAGGVKGSFQRFSYRPYRYTRTEHGEYVYVQMSIRSKYELVPILNFLIDRNENSAYASLCAAVYFQELVNVYARLFVLISMTKHRQEMVEKCGAVVRAYDIASEILKTRDQSGVIHNEAAYGDPTLSQISSLQAEAYTRLLDAEKRVATASAELCVLIGSEAPAVVDLSLPPVNSNVSLEYLMATSPALRQAYLSYISSTGTKTKESLQLIVRDMSMSLSLNYTYREFWYMLFWHPPFSWAADANMALRFSFADFTNLWSRRAMAGKAESEYYTAFIKAYEQAKEWALSATRSLDTVEAYLQAVEENRKEMSRLEEILARDPLDHSCLYKFAEAASRYCDSVERLERALTAAADVYFRFTLERPKQLKSTFISIQGPQKVRLNMRSGLVGSRLRAFKANKTNALKRN